MQRHRILVCLFKETALSFFGYLFCNMEFFINGDDSCHHCEDRFPSIVFESDYPSLIFVFLNDPILAFPLSRDHRGSYLVGENLTSLTLTPVFLLNFGLILNFLGSTKRNFLRIVKIKRWRILRFWLPLLLNREKKFLFTILRYFTV